MTNGDVQITQTSQASQPPHAEGQPLAGVGTVRQSWGRYPRIEAGTQASVALNGLDSAAMLEQCNGTLLPYGMGRSYGDSCLNPGGTLLETRDLNCLIAFDEETGLLRCESGVSLAQVLAFAVPRGWFLPTTPGTKFVTIGGAIANDVHGKNHHVAGTFGRHVTRFELVRSDGSVRVCSPTENAELYSATIGGLGLTGLITWAEVQLRAVAGPYIEMESIKFGSLDEYFAIAAESDQGFEATMSWVDCMASGASLGRGLLMRGNHSWRPRIPGLDAAPKQKAALPFDFPAGVLNSFSIRAFNTLYYNAQLAKQVRKTVPYEPFFYPLDSITDWNRMYGSRGFMQHQCVVPHPMARDALRAILGATSRAGEGSFLAVLKNFGHMESPGLLSFPRPGVTLALDFANRGPRTFRLLDELDRIVVEHGGAIYPAKDARMSPETFEASFPHWREFAKHIDERFSSSFWRRVTQGKDQASA